MNQPRISIVGKPNTGKSTLVNLLSKTKATIVADTPGVTRDRVVVECEIEGIKVNLIDTGGFVLDKNDEISAQIMEQLKIATRSSDIVICLFDISQPPSLLDKEIISFLRKNFRGKIIFTGNKIDKKSSRYNMDEFLSLPIDDLIKISAAHKKGIGQLKEKIAEEISKLPAPETTEENQYELKLLICGRPNVGKSTLINSITGSRRLIVSPHPGTTRDCIQVEASTDYGKILLIDSAGVRRKRSIKFYLEELIVINTIHYLKKADVAVLLVDGSEGIVRQDERLAGLILRRGKGLVIGINKWDIVRNREKSGKKETLVLPELLNFVPAVAVSALKGWNLNELIKESLKVKQNLHKRIQTPLLNKFLKRTIEQNPPPLSKSRSRRRPVKIYYATQPETSPPRFVFFSNAPESIPANWKKYLENRLRSDFGFEGVALNIEFSLKR